MNKDEILRVARSVLGMRLDAAKQYITSNGLIYRIVSQDGIQFGGTSDSLGYRINLELIDEIVRDARVG